jgi:hypothetical protein
MATPGGCPEIQRPKSWNSSSTSVTAGSGAQLFGSSLVHLLVYVIGHIQITKLRATKKLQQLETM